MKAVRDVAIDLHNLRLVSEAPGEKRSERKVTIDIVKRRSAGKQAVYEMWIVSETAGFMNGFAALECVSKR